MSSNRQAWVITVDSEYLYYPLPPSTTKVQGHAFLYGSEDSARRAIEALRDVYPLQTSGWVMDIQSVILPLSEDECL